MDRSDNLWTRRSKSVVTFPISKCQLWLTLQFSSNKLSLNNENHETKGDHPTRNYSAAKRFGGDSGSLGRGNPFNSIPPLNTNTTSSPTAGASNAFGLGSGAFASFSSSKTPKTPGNAFDWMKSSGQTPGTPGEKKDDGAKENAATARTTPSASLEKAAATAPTATGSSESSMALKYTWVIWYRPPTSKNSDYEKSTKPVCKMPTAVDFWRVYTHLKRPSSLPTVSDYHFFRDGIRPVWEDDENKMGGKWIMRLKKGVADRYWEDLLMAMIGDQFAEASDEVCGAVLSVRSGEDVLSVWTKNNGGRNIKIR